MNQAIQVEEYGNPGKRYSEYLKSHESYCDGTALLIVSQANYADEKKLTVTVGDAIFKGHITDNNREGFDVAIVGTDSAVNGKGADFDITFKNIEFTDENCDFGTFREGNLKQYLIDIGTSCEKNIVVNGNTNLKTQCNPS